MQVTFRAPPAAKQKIVIKVISRCSSSSVSYSPSKTQIIPTIGPALPPRHRMGSHVLHPPKEVHPTCDKSDVNHWGKRLRACVAWSWLLLVSVIGGLLLGLWLLRYHPTNSQLWMVPFGLVLLITPIFTWTAVIASEMCCRITDSQVRHLKQPSNDPLV